MSRGLGKLQKRIIERLKVHKSTVKFHQFVEHEVVAFEGWHSIAELLHEVQDDFPTNGLWDDYNYHERTETEKQSFWRAIRCLEKRGIIETKFFLAGTMDRPNNGNRRGGISRQKAMRLVQ